MTCKETKDLLNAYVDGELDSAGSLSVENHVQRCTSCLADMENLRGLSSAIQNGGLRFTAPPHLKRKMQAAIRAAHPEVKRPFFDWGWASAFASAALVAVLGFALTTQWKSSSAETLLVDDIISSHVRSMMANHITDVASSDSHTVKPWFGGKLDYSPPAKDLTAQGFRLVGGRMDYLDNRPVAAVVYQRSQHFINLFVWPSSNNAIKPEDQLTRRGYNIIHWTQAGMTYWLVSELNLPELSECARLLKE
jgi:anti-sigma factor RsiW